MEKTGGRRIYNINPRAKYLSQEIDPTIFQQNTEGKHSKNKGLHQNLRVWMKIILGTIQHRPTSNSSDYINTDQKCILYYIHKGLKLCLPALLFKYLKDSIKDTRNNMKTRNYIPLEDVTIDIGRPLNARNLKSMGRNFWVKTSAFKLKGLSEQVRYDFIKDVGIRLQARLAREDEENVKKEAEEQARTEEEQRIREAEEKVVAVAAAAEAGAKALADVEEAAHIAVKEAAKARADALT
ncbi:uncharacterized protein LOC127136575 [Lathyrus oleraceus]|uniref:uncharacterized protein LOC127136575 n=1 Tax=Pisum sativum TaxID=3888 RepID=UPI0021CE4D1A|nr:uncharacterized protein LOC127136575 [Pisum sativum]